MSQRNRKQLKRIRQSTKGKRRDASLSGIKQAFKKDIKIIVCFYTCKQDKDYLNKIKNTAWYRYLQEDDRYTLLDVYSDPNIESRYVIKNGVLKVRGEERYTRLSVKTYDMMAACLDMDFNYLIKIDATVIDPRKVKREYESFNYIKKFVLDDSFYKEYNGTCVHKSKHPWKGVHRWAEKKNINGGVRPEVIFKDLKFVEYFCGKTYVVGRDFCKYIVDFGRERAISFENHMGGSEDMMVGSLHRKFINWRKRNA